jgi:hypothetical protein
VKIDYLHTSAPSHFCNSDVVRNELYSNSSVIVLPILCFFSDSDAVYHNSLTAVTIFLMMLEHLIYILFRLFSKSQESDWDEVCRCMKHTQRFNLLSMITDLVVAQLRQLCWVPKISKRYQRFLVVTQIADMTPTNAHYHLRVISHRCHTKKTPSQLPKISSSTFLSQSHLSLDILSNENDG